ncbi:MAG TPA: methyltransferase domain-containing protein [Phototrophicaceae bacterium]|nr:methyltransferase domain-containing protein [Phototrophicaceae bacterium]
MTMPWNPERYHQFERERSAPFDDLLQLIERRAAIEVIDLGCGTGELTRRLADYLPDSNVLGIDSSPEMLAQASAQIRPGLRFEHGQIEAVTGQWDLVFSNAAIQWVPDHPALIPRLLGLVKPGGQLIVQLPSNHDSFAHRAITATASESPFREALDGWIRPSPVLPLDQYAELLYANGGRRLTVFEKVYPHVLENAEAVRDWTRGTALVPYMERLPEALHAPFLERYTERLRTHWPASPVFYSFKRTLFAATVGSD